MTFNFCDLSKPVFTLVKPASTWNVVAGTVIGFTATASVTEPLKTSYLVLLNAGPPAINRPNRIVFDDQTDAAALAALLNT